MHPNPIFRKATRAQNLSFARQTGFGTLCVNGAGGPHLAHVPFILSADGAHARFHLMRSNPVLQAAPGPAVLSVLGPHGYISPDWYGLPDQVPTWNYVAVQLRGHIETAPASELKTLLEAQSAAFEARLAPKPQWTLDKMSPDALARMMRIIVPVVLHVEQVDGTWKANQNKPDSARLAAATHVQQTGQGFESAQLADIMRQVLMD